MSLRSWRKQLFSETRRPIICFLFWLFSTWAFKFLFLFPNSGIFTFSPKWALHCISCDLKGWVCPESITSCRINFVKLCEWHNPQFHVNDHSFVREWESNSIIRRLNIWSRERKREHQECLSSFQSVLPKESLNYESVMIVDLLQAFDFCLRFVDGTGSAQLVNHFWMWPEQERL